MAKWEAEANNVDPRGDEMCENLRVPDEWDRDTDPIYKYKLLQFKTLVDVAMPMALHITKPGDLVNIKVSGETTFNHTDDEIDQSITIQVTQVQKHERRELFNFPSNEMKKELGIVTGE